MTVYIANPATSNSHLIHFGDDLVDVEYWD